MVPIGIAYLAAVAREGGIDVQILDQYTECLTQDKIEDRTRKFSPNLIGYGTTTPNFSAAITMVRKLRRVFPEIKTVLGDSTRQFFLIKQYKILR